MFWGLSQVALDFTIIYLGLQAIQVLVLLVIIFSSEKISLKFLWTKTKNKIISHLEEILKQYLLTTALKFPMGELIFSSVALNCTNYLTPVALACHR